MIHVHDDQLTFQKWKAEKPNGLVLRPDDQFVKSYASANWEERMQKTLVVTPASPDDQLPPRELTVGIDLNGPKAYPFSTLEKQSPIVDVLNGTPIITVPGEGKKSVRVFEQVIDSQPVELFQKSDSSQLPLVDPQTTSEFDFSGKAINSTWARKQLKQIDLLLDYWFDWNI